MRVSNKLKLKSFWFHRTTIRAAGLCLVKNGVKNVGTKPTKVDTFALTVITGDSRFSFDQKVHIVGILASL